MNYKRCLRIIFRSLLVFLAFIGIYLLSAFGLSRITTGKEEGTKSEVTIYILTNGIHTDLVVPVSTNQMDWKKEIQFRNIKSTDTTFQYLAMGWGDKGFYLQTPTWGDLKFSVAFKAAFALSHSAVHATYYHEMHEGADCKKIMISREQYARLIHFISDSFEKDASGQWIPIRTDANYSDTDAFYEATGSYRLFYTCNTWANNGLKSCGQKACLWTIFDTGIFMKYNQGY